MALAFPNRIIEGTAGLAYLEPTKVEPNLFAGHNNPGDPPLRRAVRPPQSPRSGPRCGPRCGTWTGTGTRQRKGRWIHLDRPHSVMRHEPLHSPSAPFRILVGNLHPKKRSGIFWRTMGQTCLKLRCNNKASRLQRVQGRPAATLSSGTSRSGRSSCNARMSTSSRSTCVPSALDPQTSPITFTGIELVWLFLITPRFGKHSCGRGQFIAPACSAQGKPPRSVRVSLHRSRGLRSWFCSQCRHGLG